MKNIVTTQEFRKFGSVIIQKIKDALEAFCNTRRIHSHCDYTPPNEFE